MRFPPISLDTLIIVQTCAVAIPTLSNSLDITAPQRVLVPHVDVRIAALIPAFISSSAIPFPIIPAFSITAPTPAVV